MEALSDAVAYEDIAFADWMHVKNCTCDLCNATVKLEDLSSFSKYISMSIFI